MILRNLFQSRGGLVGMLMALAFPFLWALMLDTSICSHSRACQSQRHRQGRDGPAKSARSAIHASWASSWGQLEQGSCVGPQGHGDAPSDGAVVGVSHRVPHGHCLGRRPAHAGPARAAGHGGTFKTTACTRTRTQTDMSDNQTSRRHCTCGMHAHTCTWMWDTDSCRSDTRMQGVRGQRHAEPRAHGVGSRSSTRCFLAHPPHHHRFPLPSHHHVSLP